MLLAWDNLVDASTVTAGSEIVTLPGSNVKQPHLSRKWYTVAGVKSSNIIFDRGASLPASLGALLGSNLTAAATVRWRASNTDPTVTSSTLLDTTTVAAGAKAGYGASYKTWASVTARYWRADIADASLPDNLRIGRIVLAPTWQPSVNMELNWSVAAVDPSTVDYSYGRQAFGDVRPQQRMLQFSLDFMDEAEMYGNAFALARFAGIVKDILAIPDIASAWISEQAVWGLLTSSEPLTNARIGLYRQRFNVMERL